MMHIGPGDVRSPINLPATQGFDIYPQERPHQPHQLVDGQGRYEAPTHWMPHGIDPRNHMPVRYMADGPAAAPGSTVPMVDGQGRYEAPTLQQLLGAYLHETTDIKHEESRPRPANTRRCRGY